jgi:diacylglycerol kinase (ATP)
MIGTPSPTRCALLISKSTTFKRALKERYDLVAAGGDGTIGHVFTHLPNRATPIGILPLGSANNIARSLGIAGTPAELAEQWRGSHIRPFHLMEVRYEAEEMQLCTEGFGVGLMAALIKRRAKGAGYSLPRQMHRNPLACRSQSAR